MTMPENAPIAYSAHEQLVRTARARPELWRLLVGLVLIGLFITALNLVFIAVVAGLGPNDWAVEFLQGASPLAMLVLLSSFGFVTLGVAVVARQLHNRSLSSILGPYSQGLRQFWQVFRALLILGVLVAALPPYDMGAPLTQNMALSTWLFLLPFSAAAVLIQISSEEVLFRGYIQQSLAARFRSPVIWMGLPSVLFAAGHYAPAAAGDNALLIAAWSCLFGLLASDLTARAGTLGPAIALHFFNNVIALLLISLPGNLSGLALFLLPIDMADTEMLRPWLYVDFAVMLVCWLTARLAIRR
ncbi:CPBP family intramembrane metalloprotease [Rhodobacteraceae bacterium B1Z28]|uniref:CPBP family intramembrane metalloprotease n=1 Tax=Ruegeria haliotis TaxID=2747601 RepID=A0ABX2PR95_9RHOB|nr:CPBP family intramembrane glutamic endopeptidase [Ruegeria haliotis]NVO56270.1 CPBP family intramembrane metalloprotease [Ruegeria haliotis]